MNGAELGAKCSGAAAKRLQAVVPSPSGLSGPFHSNAAPPHSCTSIPRCFLYHAPSAVGSVDLKKIPPIPVTRFMAVFVLARLDNEVLRGLTECIVGFNKNRCKSILWGNI